MAKLRFSFASAVPGASGAQGQPGSVMICTLVPLSVIDKVAVR